MNKSTILCRCAGGTVELPGKILNDRLDGGHLHVNPARSVWERSELTPAELTNWSFLIAATGRAMLDTLPQLSGGCLNYWDAGNWALNNQAPPVGPKESAESRRVHMHVFGRSRTARHPDWQWGESPRFPAYVDSDNWSAQFIPLNQDECTHVSHRIWELLRDTYRMS